ncbi:MAG: hypothetical protein IID09_07195, partial [Candidatus Hydrogenedentes bacterium]|nr:hypothetical protein [Candidatus Hydrogenedentota bacterium]
MNPKVKALAWEECRVGGAIAAVCLLVGFITLLSLRFSYGWTTSSANHNRDFLDAILLGVPMLTALLLILNPNYSGHLAGGFSTRVLRLPVNASIAVATALVARTIFVFVVALVLSAAAQALSGDVPVLRIATSIVFFYLFAQALDWLRGPISGLSSILLVLCVAGIVSVLAGGGRVFEAVLEGFEMTLLGWVLALATAMTAAYFVSIAAVHATRVGRSTGIPEIWEWPKRMDLGGRGRTKVFSSPMAAQIWFETRRAGWTLPFATLLLWLIASGALWLYLRSGQDPGQASLTEFRGYSSVFILVSFFLATFIHGIKTRVVGIGRIKEATGHEWMQPLTSAEFASARILSTALLFLPTLVLVTAIHFALIGGYFLMSFVPEALAMGTASIREVVWVVLSRGVLLGIVAWMFVAIGTRLLRASAAVALFLLVVSVIVGFLDNINFITSGAQEVALWGAITLFLLYLVGLTGYAYVRLWKEGCIPLRSAVTWGAVWAIASCFIYYVTLFSRGEPSGETPLYGHLEIPGLAYGSPAAGPAAWDNLITSLAYGSLVVLPYAAILLDLRRRRHGASRGQDPIQHKGARGGLSPNAKVAMRALAAATVLFMIWLAWPARPAYEALWRSNGNPATLAELNAWYKEVPDDENVALNYSSIAEGALRSANAYFNSAIRHDGPTIDNYLIVGRAKLSRTETIVQENWDFTEEYWQKVTAPIASRLKEIAEGPSRPSRYPIDLLEGYMVKLEHLAKLRNLARELLADALHWTVADDTGEATASIRAIFPIAKSLSGEPVLISQLVRFTILSIAVDAIETTMNRGLL